MSAPLDFLRLFAGLLRSAGIRFAITSGMACVHYGLQQTTKDSDWIIAPEDMAKLRELLIRLEAATPPWRISYRPIFGAPLDIEYMAHGWTSHLLVTDPDGAEHKVDLFGKPPRVQSVETEPGDPDYASRHVVAMMKRTDRDRDWPIVDGLGWQLGDRKRTESALHIQEPVRLQAEWARTPANQRPALAARRPLLLHLESETDSDRLLALIRMERTIWECVNHERYERYTRAWKEFYRNWRAKPGWQWPTVEPFTVQHSGLAAAARLHGLSADPMTSSDRPALVENAVRRAAVLSNTTPENLARITPPLGELLP